MKPSNLQYHSKYDLCTNIDIPHGRKVFKITIQYISTEEEPIKKPYSHENENEKQPQVDELYASDSNDGVSEESLLVDRTCELGALLDDVDHN